MARISEFRWENMNNTRNTEKINLITKTTELAMDITLKYVNQGDAVIDATAGNGHDTLVFARAVGEQGRVLAFDVQEQALENTEKLLQENGITVVRNFTTKTNSNTADCTKTQNENTVSLILDSHENMGKYCTAETPISAIMFNLGYLPLSDKSIATNAASSIKAIEEALKLIKKDGIVTVVLYSGHEGGQAEKQAILDITEKLSSKEYHVVYASMHNQANNPPEVLWITKKK